MKIFPSRRPGSYRSSRPVLYPMCSSVESRGNAVTRASLSRSDGSFRSSVSVSVLAHPPCTSAGPRVLLSSRALRQPPGTWLTTTLAATNTPSFIMWSR